MFSQGKKSISLVVTSGTLLSTSVFFPIVSTNAVKENQNTNVGNAIWWTFTIGTFGLYALYWYFFKGSDDGDSPLFEKENVGINGMNNSKFNSPGTEGPKKNVIENSKLKIEQKRTKRQELEETIKRFKIELEKAKNEKEDLEYTIKDLKEDIESNEKKIKELPHAMVLEFNKKAKEFNKNIEEYKQKIQKYKDEKKEKIEEFREKCMQKKGIARINIEKGDVYGFMNYVEKEFLNPIDTIDENTLDKDLDFASYKKQSENIKKYRVKCVNLVPFEDFLYCRYLVFLSIKQKDLKTNKDLIVGYSDGLQKYRIEMVREEERLSNVNTKIAGLRNSLEVYRKELEMYGENVGNFEHKQVLFDDV